MGNKKARKMLERQQRMQWEHSAKAHGRTVLPTLHRGAVLRRDRGFVWLKVTTDAELPDVVAKAVAANADSALQLRYSDVSQKGLDLQVGVLLQFKVFQASDGSVGACETVAAESA